ncbi:hypothetical protein [Pseudomonas sp. Teo4]|uniref:hypothetical protein n=1 Tax=Pseudomonas sp. Teo4 TaxID=3064528 RepID=UPI002ABAE3F8|nr:hypothetical protein [Pseudomonas sp. Teo4]MDZ3990853.1 hypothetical protein [Pseudomonas sp. Teo4]
MYSLDKSRSFMAKAYFQVGSARHPIGANYSDTIPVFGEKGWLFAGSGGRDYSFVELVMSFECYRSQAGSDRLWKIDGIQSQLDLARGTLIEQSRNGYLGLYKSSFDHKSSESLWGLKGLDVENGLVTSTVDGVIWRDSSGRRVKLLTERDVGDLGVSPYLNTRKGEDGTLSLEILRVGMG